MKNILFLSLIFLITGCTIKPNKIDINTYALNFNSKIKNDIQINKNLLILKPVISKSFDTKKIIYTQKPFSFESYGKNRWLDLPSSMIKEQLIHTIENNNIFKNVLDSYSNIDSFYILQTNINKLYHKFEGKKSYAIVSGKFLLIKNREVISSYIYTKKVLCDENSPYGFVKALNNVFNKITKEFQESLLKSL